MRVRSFWWLAIPWVVACGGSTIIVDGIEIYQDQWAAATEEIGRLASFQLDCPAEELRFSLLRREQSRQPEQVGVEGCGSREVYTRVGRVYVPSGNALPAAQEHQARQDRARRLQQSQQQQNQQY